MCLAPKPARTTERCKLKRVYPRLPLRVHSAVLKGLAGSSAGNPGGAEPPALGTIRGYEWSPDRLRIRLESELSSEAWRSLESAARRHGRSLDDFLLGALEEVP